MPLYRYKCQNCETEFTKLLSFKQRENKDTQLFCPECGWHEHTNMISKTSFSLKGKGWYKDGYSGKDS